MSLTPGRWLPLTPEIVADLPDHAGIFEVSNLVRTVLYIARAEGHLRSRLATLAHPNPTLPRLAGGYYFRYELGESEEELHARRLAEYCAGHRGAAPPANRQAPRSLRVAPREAA